MTVLDAATRTAQTAASCPYRGLRPFAVGDARYFFGRDADREVIAANLIAARLTLLYAASGVGKTSVLLAGVVHDLLGLAAESAAEGHGPEYLPVVVRRWSADPMRAIDAALADGATRLLGAPPDPLPAGERLVDRLRGWADATDTTLLLILDQFEEFLRYHGSAWEPGGAAREIADVLSARNLPANVLIGIREDSLASLDRFKGRVPYLFDNYLRLDNLDMEGARDAVLGPLAEWTREHPGDPMYVERGLVEELLADVTSDRVALGRTGAGNVARGARQGIETPFLQLVLTRLWESERAQGSNRLRVATLRSLGGAADVIRAHLDEHMSRFARRDQDVAAAVFHQLVTPSGTKVARSLDDLAAYTGEPRERIAAVLGVLSQGDWRVVRAVVEPGTDVPDTYEIFHDVLAEAILDWRARHDEQRRRRRMLRRIGLAAGTAALVALAALVLVLIFRGLAEDAKQARTKAESGELAARSRTIVATDPGQAVADARDAVMKERTPEAVLALRNALAQDNRRATFDPGRGLVRLMRISRDGSLLVAIDGERRLLDWPLGGPAGRVVLGADAVGADPSPAGRLVAFATSDGVIHVRSASGGADLASAHVPEAARVDLRWSPRGERLSAVGERWARLWRWDGRALTAAKAIDGVVLARWSPGGQMLATADADGQVTVRDADGRERARLPAHSGELKALGFSADGRRVVAVGSDGDIAVLGARDCSAGAVGPVRLAAISRDGSHVAMAGTNGIGLVDLDFGGDGCKIRFLPADLRVSTRAIAVTPGGEAVVVATSDGVARVYDARSPTTLATLAADFGRSRASLQIRDAADGGPIVFTGGNGVISQWQIGSLPLATLWRSDGVVTAAAGSDGRVSAITRDGLVTADIGAPDDEQPERLGDVRVAAFAPDGARAAVVTRAGELKLVAPGRGARTVGNAGRDATSVAFGNRTGSRRIVVARSRGSAAVWDAGRPHAAPVVLDGPGGDRPYAAFIRDDSAVAILAGSSLWARDVGGTRPPTITPIGGRAPTGAPSVTRVAAQGDRLVFAVARDQPREWALEGDPAELPTADSFVSGLAYRSADSLLATAGEQGVKLIERREDFAFPRIAAQPFSGVAFSLDGRWLVAFGPDTGVQVFPCRACGDVSDLLARAARRGGLIELAAIAPAAGERVIDRERAAADDPGSARARRQGPVGATNPNGPSGAGPGGATTTPTPEGGRDTMPPDSEGPVDEGEAPPDAGEQAPLPEIPTPEPTPQPEPAMQTTPEVNEQ